MRKFLWTILLVWLGSIAPATAAEVPALGLNDWSRLNSQDLQVLSATDLDYYRVPLRWSEVERRRGRYDWSAFDRLMKSAACRGVRLLPVLQDSPPWVGPPQTPPTGRAQTRWLMWVRASIGRYGPHGSWRPDGVFCRQSGRPRERVPVIRLLAVQVWNEPNLRAFWRPPRADSYAQLLAVTQQTIRVTEPEMVVLAAGLAYRDRVGQFLEQIVTDPVMVDLPDGVAIHTYLKQPGQVIAAAEQTRQALDKLGGNQVDLWITEFGYSTGPQPNKSEQTAQQRWLDRTVTMLDERRAALQLGPMFWFSYRDATCSRKSPIFKHCHAGLLHSNGFPKPAWQTAVDLAEELTPVKIEPIE